MSLSPIPEFGLINFKNYSNMSVQYSRGCPFSCEFCDIIEIYGRAPRTKSNQQILAEFDELKRLGWRGPLFIVGNKVMNSAVGYDALKDAIGAARKSKD